MPYWLLEYQAINLPDSLMGPGLIMIGLAAFLLYTSGATVWWKGTLTVAASVPAVVFIRVLVEGFKDPTSHNLWPLEMIIALGVGLFSASMGGIVGIVFEALVRKRTSHKEGVSEETRRVLSRLSAASCHQRSLSQ